MNESTRMAAIEERFALLKSEQIRLKIDNVELKKSVELQTMSIVELANKAPLERLNNILDLLKGGSDDT